LRNRQQAGIGSRAWRDDPVCQQESLIKKAITGQWEFRRVVPRDPTNRRKRAERVQEILPEVAPWDCLAISH
jgi:hypothetical protein